MNSSASSRVSQASMPCVMRSPMVSKSWPFQFITAPISLVSRSPSDVQPCGPAGVPAAACCPSRLPAGPPPHLRGSDPRGTGPVAPWGWSLPSPKVSVLHPLMLHVLLDLPRCSVALPLGVLSHVLRHFRILACPLALLRCGSLHSLTLPSSPPRAVGRQS